MAEQVDQHQVEKVDGGPDEELVPSRFRICYPVIKSLVPKDIS